MGAKKVIPGSTGRLLDARSKIIQKNRVKIRDARDKIAESARSTIKDARELLSKKPASGARAKKGLTTRTRSIRNAKDEPMDDDSFRENVIDFFEKSKPLPVAALKRTVRNEMFLDRAPPISMPKMPSFSIKQELSRMSPDPFDCYNVAVRRPVPLPPRRPERMDRYQQGRNMSAHMDAYEPRKPSLRAAISDDHDDRFEDDRYFSSGDPVRSRLYKDSRERNESAGIFAKLPVQGTSPPLPAQVVHRIIISNLHHSVNEKDVRELFADVGPLVSAKLLREGVAEVVYKNIGDAEEAVETYHNRQLDHQPMKVSLCTSSSLKVYSRL